MKGIENGLANVTVFCLLSSLATVSVIVVIIGLQIIAAPDGSIGNNLIRNVTSTVDYGRELAGKFATIGKRG